MGKWESLKEAVENLEGSLYSKNTFLDLMLKIEKGEEIEAEKKIEEPNPFKVGDRVKIRETHQYGEYEREKMGKVQEVVGQVATILEVAGEDCVLQFDEPVSGLRNYKEKFKVLDFLHELKVGDRVLIELRVPYTEEELKKGCDNNVNGRYAEVEEVKGDLIELVLEDPIIYYVKEEEWDPMKQYKEEQLILKERFDELEELSIIDEEDYMKADDFAFYAEKAYNLVKQ